MNKFNMFITAVCVLFLIKLRWPKNKSIYETVLSSKNRGDLTSDVVIFARTTVTKQKNYAYTV